MLKKVLVGLLSVLLIGLAIYGCGQVTRDEEPAGTGYLIGRVFEINGTTPLDEVIVTVTGVSTSASTSGSGYFTVLNVPATDRAVVNFSKSGYVSTTKIAVIQSGSAAYVETNMAPASAAQTVNADNGGIARDPNNNDATVTIDAGTLRDADGNVVTGDVDVGVTSFNPLNENEAAAFPGNFAGEVNGQEQPFISLGFMDVTVQQGGEDLNINSTSRIEIPIPASEVATAPDTIPLWYFNAERGVWVQQGTATKVVNVYQGNVEHFSTWNADYLYEEAYKSGKVIDEEGNPVAGATVVAEGDGWRNETITDSNGEYTLPIEPNAEITEYARKGTSVSIPVDETAPPTGETKDVADIVLAAPLATITLTWGLNPDDLDSHLTGPTPEGQSTRFHCYWVIRDPVGSYVSLDIDVIDSYGPEHIGISRFRQGTYRYAVDNFAETHSIYTSEAVVRLDIPSKGIIGQLFTPPSLELPTQEVWRVFDLIVDASGNVTVQTIGDYADEYDPDAFLLFSLGAFNADVKKKK